MSAWAMFIYLQVLDLLTTLIGFSAGAQEWNPAIVQLIKITDSPLSVLVGIKILVIVVVLGWCEYYHETRLLIGINYFYMFIVLWNLSSSLLLVVYSV